MLATLCQKNLSKTENFAQFVFGHPLPRKRMYDFLLKAVIRKSLEDATTEAVFSEDACLFDATGLSSLDIICRHLRILDTGGKIGSVWCWLDEDKKAVVHFLQKGGWYAEAYFASNENFSVLHLLENGEQKHFVPVVFTNNLQEVSAKVASMRGIYLHNYLPRVKYDLLSKSGKQSKKNFSSSQNNDLRTSQNDKWDSL